jgi:hypothetical protein
MAPNPLDGQSPSQTQTDTDLSQYNNREQVSPSDAALEAVAAHPLQACVNPNDSRGPATHEFIDGDSVGRFSKELPLQLEIL